MMPRYPSLYQINTRVWLTELGRASGQTATLDDIPDAELERLAEQGFDWIWLLSVWQTGAVARQISLSHQDWRHEFADTLPDLTEQDIAGSGFAITGYSVNPGLGGDAALARLRERLRRHGLKLMLDFVPNHLGLGHPWIESHPDYFVQGSEQDQAIAPQNYTRMTIQGCERIFAYGRDPFFPGWPDTLQLNYANPSLQEAMTGELLRISEQCDGVRCDMAMLLLPDVFERTWGCRTSPFWPTVTQRVRQQVPGFTFLAEVYWDLEWTMQQQGFDYAYDKRLYDRLCQRHAHSVLDHLRAGVEFQDRLARFLENHDEPRAAASFAADVHRAAAVITYCSPGLRFFHQGQLEGKTKRISPHLLRGPNEPVDEPLRQFYEQLLAMLRWPLLHDGQWQLLTCTPGWQGNWTHDCFIAFGWHDPSHDNPPVVVVVNFSDHQSQCHIQLPFKPLAGRNWKLSDKLSSASYEWTGDDLTGQGLFVDMTAWQACIFTLTEC